MLKQVSGAQVELEGKEVTDPGPQPTAEELIAQLDVLGDALRALIIRSKHVPRTKGLDPHQDPSRSLALAQSHLQTGFMWLRRAIDMPKVF